MVRRKLKAMLRHTRVAAAAYVAVLVFLVVYSRNVKNERDVAFDVAAKESIQRPAPQLLPDTDMRDFIFIRPWGNNYYGSPTKYWFQNEPGPESFETCAESRCSVEDDPDKSDAILISHNFISFKQKNFQLPARVSPKQKWIFYSWESPQNLAIRPEFQHIFNGTFTYMSKSNAQRPYGQIVRRRQPLQTYDDKDWPNKKNVLWLVSHCNTSGGRETYVAELAKHIDVTIYGKCDNDSCGLYDPCGQQVDRSFKFYLSFENSLCHEYATEKLFRTFDTHMIPIVYGLYDYKTNLAPNSVIDVRDFKSPKHLADYLKVVSQDKTLFDSYFHWKENLVTESGLWYPGVCNLCEYLHKTRDDPPTTVHLDEFWNNETMCIPRDKFLESVGVHV